MRLGITYCRQCGEPLVIGHVCDLSTAFHELLDAEQANEAVAEAELDAEAAYDLAFLRGLGIGGGTR